MLHNANRKLIDPAAMEVKILRLSVGLPAEVVSGAITGAFVDLGYTSPTANQEEAILEFVKGHDVFVSLPTGEGKSLCYATLPLVFDGFRRYLQANGEQEFSCRCIVFVVSPLLALMKDQVATFEKRGLKCAYVGQEPSIKAAVVAGEYQLVYITPEYLLRDLKIREMFRSDIFVDNLVALVVDEAHCIDTW